MSAATTPFVRDSSSDNGAIPNNGAINVSPDIMPQQSPVNPTEVQAKFGAATYSQDPGQNIEEGQDNYIYLRAKNPETTAQNVNISVYWALPSTLQHPSTWKQNQIGTAQPLALPANGGIVAASEPAIWNAAQLPGVGHYCLITELTGDGLPTMPSSFPSVDAWWQYCRDHNTVAQRNINVVDDINDGKVQKWLNLLNPGLTSSKHQIQAVCNVPANSTVSLYSPSSSINPPISTGDRTINGTNNGQIITVESSFPASLQTGLEITFTPPSGAPAGTYSIVLQQFLIDGAELKHLGSYTFEIKL